MGPSRVRARRSLPAGLLVLGLTGTIAAAQPPLRDGASVFRPPVVAIPAELQQTEPQVHVTPGGTVLVGSQFQRFDCQTGAPRLAGSRACIWRSDDGGATFQRSGGGQNTGADVHFARLPSGVLLYTTLAQPEPGTFTSGVGGATILRSTDNGTTWSSPSSTASAPRSTGRS